MKKKNRQRKTHHLKLSHLGSAILFAMMILPWGYPAFLDLNIEQVSTKIRHLESQRNSLNNSLRRQTAEWNTMTQPQKLDEAVRQNGIRLAYAPPERSIIVRKDGCMEIPASLHASLEKTSIAQKEATSTRRVASTSTTRRSSRNRR
jgi:hypothetical protein